MATVVLTDKEIREARRLGTCLDSQLVPVKDLRIFLAGLQQKIDQSVAPGRRKSAGVKEDRKNHFKAKLKIA